MFCGFYFFANDRFALNGVKEYMQKSISHHLLCSELMKIKCCIILVTNESLIEAYHLLLKTIRISTRYEMVFIIGSEHARKLAEVILPRRIRFISVNNELNLISDEIITSLLTFKIYNIHKKTKSQIMFTNTEYLILNQMLTGMSVNEISEKMGISVKTVSSHKMSAMRKLHVSTNQLLVLKHKLLQLADAIAM
jgi:DNA-binding NarL/FixJ family response regulator